MGNLKKKILPEEWELIQTEAVDPACSLARLFDILRGKRVEKGIELLNRSWFLAFMQNVCHCRDGKIGKKFRVPASAMQPESDVKPSEETPSVTSENVPEESISGPLTASVGNTESASDLLSEKTLYVLKWMFHNGKTEVFSQFWTIGGYQKKIATDAASELLNLGVISKKNPKRFNAFDWDQLILDFPEITQDLEDRPEWKCRIQPTSLVKISKSTESKKEETLTEDPLSKKLDSWLHEEDHINGEFTQKELTEELVRLHAKNPYTEASVYINKWINEGKIQNVRGTSAYRIYGYQPSVEEPEETITPMENLRRSLGFPSSGSTESRRMPENAKALVVHMENGKDIEIRNNSNSKLRLTVENDKVILTILP